MILTTESRAAALAVLTLRESKISQKQTDFIHNCLSDDAAIINSISDTEDFIRLGRIYALYRFRQSDRLPEMPDLLNGSDTALKCEMVRLLSYGIDSGDIAMAVTAFKHYISSDAENDEKT